jgi:hypothetical protein
MHVSRLLTRTLTRLRDYFVDDVDLPPEWLDEDAPRERRRGERVAA